MITAWLILILLGGGLLAALIGRWHPDWSRWVSLLTLLLAGYGLLETWLTGQRVSADEQIVYASLSADWIPRFGIQLLLVMDGLSLLMVALTLFLGVVAVLSSWTEIEHRAGFFQLNVLWTLAGVVGVFTALDLFLFFLFWEVMLVPMYFLIAIWGHEQRAYASMKFFLFTQISGLLMLLAIIGLAFAHSLGVFTSASAACASATRKSVQGAFALATSMGALAATDSTSARWSPASARRQRHSQRRSWIRLGQRQSPIAVLRRPL